jgi:hypothetical protein
MALSREEAESSILEFVKKIDLKGYSYSLIDVRLSRRQPNKWSAIFDVYSSKGGLIDGPVIFTVDKDTGEIKDDRS